MWTRTITCLLAATLAATAQAQHTLRLPDLFGSGMVLQRQQPNNVWGWAEAGSRVTIELAGRRASALTAPDGTWMVALDPMPAGGPHEMTIASGDVIRFNDVLVGDVWIASGQSNMQWPLSATNNARDVIRQADHASIRLLKFDLRAETTPRDDSRTSGWNTCTPDTVADFSAVAYHFGRELNNETGIPIGLIQSAWGGTLCEAWTPLDHLEGQPDFQAIVDRVAAFDEAAQNQTAVIDAARTRFVAFYENLQFHADDLALAYHQPGLDDRSWPTITQPANWETVEPDVDGVVWLRHEFRAPADWTGRDATLSLGPIDDFDRTFVNGVEIGRTGPEFDDAWNRSRAYDVPPGVLTAGRNVVSIRVIDYTGGGGLHGTDEDLALRADGLEPISLAGNWRYKVALDAREHTMLAPWQNNRYRTQDRPGSLYNGMIHPMRHLAARGVIWYQGESNAQRAQQYRTLFVNMIRSWRSVWGNEDLAFLFVQLANFMPRHDQPTQSAWAELREAQDMALAEPATAQACIIDIGEAGDIHPRNKLDVGRRLALGALAICYGRDTEFSGPRPRKTQLQGKRAVVAFDHAKGLRTTDGRDPTGFAVAGDDRAFRWADARIDGDRVVLTHPDNDVIRAVRYAWADNPDVNLVNDAGLPAVPFRTDDWPGVTDGQR